MVIKRNIGDTVYARYGYRYYKATIVSIDKSWWSTKYLVDIGDYVIARGSHDLVDYHENQGGDDNNEI